MTIYNSFMIEYSTEDWEMILSMMDEDLLTDIRQRHPRAGKPELFKRYAECHLQYFGERWEFDKDLPVDV